MGLMFTLNYEISLSTMFEKSLGWNFLVCLKLCGKYADLDVC